MDNSFLSDSIKEEIERLKYTDEQYWQIYGLGIKGISKSTIFRYVEVNQIPEDAEFISYGADAGYTNDPTTLVCQYYRKEYDLYIKEHLYQNPDDYFRHSQSLERRRKISAGTTNLL